MNYQLFVGAFKLTTAELIVLYAVLVVSILRTEGTQYELRFDPRELGRSGLRLMVWLGVQTTAAILSVLKASLSTLEDASADVGEWILHRRST